MTDAEADARGETYKATMERAIREAYPHRFAQETA